MAIHRLEALVSDLITKQNYPSDIPCAIIERASCKDQRVIWATLSTIVQALERNGGSRPPGLLVVGHAINVLKHENKGIEGVAANLMTESGLSIEQDFVKSSALLSLHDPESVY
jgi:uroporphyrin-III C-methyltransferase